MDGDIKAFRRHLLPMVGLQVDVLCNYQGSLQVAPFRCCWSGTQWTTAGSGRALEVEVVAWRHPKPRVQHIDVRACLPMAATFELHTLDTSHVPEFAEAPALGGSC